MNAKNLILIFLLFLISCSSSRYYECKLESPLVVYDNLHLSKTICTIPAGNTFVIGKSVKRKRSINYMSFSGYAEDLRFRKVKRLPDYKFVSPDMASSSVGAQSTAVYTSNTGSIKGSGSSSSSSSSSSSGGNVQVKGYYRKNGSYVSPHVRSAPRRH
ncbi:hypothetical protein SAMN05421788_103267 [Filimonas lacunae]|uniref:Lipoprotein n=1 Tax=Filimonas lacunae TaxID=477680 RepID=A0A1N7P7R9_9BACT|nr:hypothetical protein SAMN05421788_103267 [Filimonas lacunae]